MPFNLSSYLFMGICTAVAIYYIIPPWKRLPTMDELVSKHGYGLEKHHVITSDGFVLEHHRILGKERNPIPGKVVLLNHGMLDSSNMWVLFTPERSLGFYLTDRGFDVWLLNTRGNAISRKHTKFSDESASLWNHSWHEIGIHDLPASIDYILDLTETKKVDYVGFSMGATTYFVLTSELPRYSLKINRVVAMAPAVFDVNLATMIPYTYYLISGFQATYSLAYSSGLMGGIEFHGSRCKEDTLMSRIFCSLTKAFTSRIQDENINKIEYGEAISYIYGTTSSLSVLHYYQNLISGKFAQFDYGTAMNTKVYGKAASPEYNLNNCNNTMAIFWSAADLICSTENTKKLLSLLPNVLLNYMVPVDGFSHASFFVARNTEHLINMKTYEFLQP